MSIFNSVASLYPDPKISTVLNNSMVISYIIRSSSVISCITVSTGPVFFLLGRRSFLLFDLFLQFKFLFLDFLGLINLGARKISSETNIMHYRLDNKQQCKIVSIFYKIYNTPWRKELLFCVYLLPMLVGAAKPSLKSSTIPLSSPVIITQAIFGTLFWIWFT